jgi:hypothetical protein
MLIRRRNLAERGDVGWFGSKLVKKIGKAVKSVGKAVGSIPGVKILTAPVNLVSDVARGRNVIRSIGRAGSAVVSDVRSTLPVAASLVSFVPGAGTVVGAGINAVSAASQGKSLAQIGQAAALGAIPGGQLAQSAVRAGLSVAHGGNVLKSVAREGISYARTQLPGGELAQRALNVGVNVAKGGNVLKSVAREGVSLATKSAGSQISQLAKAPMILRRPSFGLVPSISPENIGRVRSAVGLTRPNMRPNIVAKGRTAEFRPVSQSARAALLRFVPHMRGETAGLTASGAQWIVESGDTGSKIALKLTGNANRWTELKAINQNGYRLNADMVKKYGFPVKLGETLNLPASWIKVTAQTAAQSAPAQPSPTTPAAVSMPAGNLAAQSQARVVLAAWGKSDGQTEALVKDYGSSSELGATSWTARDVLQANSFASWWRRFGGPPAVADGNWSDELAQALNSWAEKKANQVTNSALSAGGVVIPSLPTIINTPVATTTTTTAQTSAAPSVLAPAGSTPTVTIQAGIPNIQVIPANTSLPSGSVLTPGGQVVAPGPITTAQTPQQTAASTSAPAMSDNAKWGLWSAIGGAALTGLIQAVK